MTEPTQIEIDYARRHVRFGWWAVLVFASLGLTLELLHGFKARAYLDGSNQTRRLVWTLAHAHGTLLGLINVAFGVTMMTFPGFIGRHLRLVSRALIGAAVLLPLGFFLGGILFYSGDPGLGVLVVPVGAVLLLIALFYIASGSRPAARSPAKTASRDRPRSH
jgi:hypothetical protein